MKKILPLDNQLMDYAWGSRLHIPRLMREPTPSEEPQAELWMGAHPKAPSRVAGRTLLEIIEDDPVGMLGATTVDRFQGRLPFLFKLLAADTPLSIQAHPTKAQAEAGFVTENAAGLSLDAPDRNYRDDNHKPELLCALTEFWALNGFRELPKMFEIFDEAELLTISSEIESFRQTPNRDGLRRFFQAVFNLDGSRKQSLLEELLGSARRFESVRPEYQWVLQISNLHPGDIGVLCVFMLNLVKLDPGQAMFCAAGDLHSYLDGFAVELMANSDNVLRGGLTPKHVDMPELMSTLTFRDRDVEVIEPEAGRYVTPADEFVLSVLEVEGRQEKRPSPGFEILVNVAGDADISLPEGDGEVRLPQGASVAIPATIAECAVSGSATIYVAGVPTP
jgi:mannose-6-phosphate isomerase